MLISIGTIGRLNRMQWTLAVGGALMFGAGAYIVATAYSWPLGMVVACAPLVALLYGATLAELRLTRSRLEQSLLVLRKANAGVAHCSGAGLSARIIDENEALEEMSGYTASELKDLALAALFPATAHESVRAHLHAARNKGQAVFESECLRKDGSSFPALVEVTITAGSGHRVSAVVQLSDISSNKIGERQLREALAQSEADKRAMERYLSTASHDLRTPLTTILAWAQMLQLKKLDAAGIKSGLATIERCARIEDQLIAGLLGKGRIQETQESDIALERSAIDPGLVLRAAVHSLDTAAKSKSLKLDVSFKSKGALVSADPARLQQILWNVLANAVKFSADGGEIVVRADLIRRDKGSFLRIVVRDSGVGIAADRLPQVFERSTGLGLSIVKRLVGLHGGEVKAESRGEGQGALFTIVLPALAAAESEAAEPIQLRDSAAAPS